MDAIQRSVIIPKIEIVEQRAAGRQILGDRPPLAAGAQDVHQTIHDFTDIHAPLAPAALGFWYQRPDMRPFLIRHVTRVAKRAAIVGTAIFCRPHRSCPASADKTLESHQTQVIQQLSGRTLRGMGIATVAATGNDGETNQMRSPACVTSTISVSAYDPEGDWFHKQLYPKANVSRLTDLFAPGRAYSAHAKRGGYIPGSGTSVAAPHVSGAIALLKSAMPDASVDSIEKAIKDAGEPVELRAVPNDPEIPRLDIAGALAVLKPPSGGGGTVLVNVIGSPSLGNLSFLRFFNTTTRRGRATVTLLDAADGTELGTWTSEQVSSLSSPQVSISNIEDGLDPVFFPTDDIPVYTALVTSDFRGYVQHVVWNRTAGTITNMSGCNNGFVDDTRNLINVHTTTISGYPSYITIYNSDPDPAVAELTIRDARTGTVLAEWESPSLPGYSQGRFVISRIEEDAMLDPGSRDFHYILNLNRSFPGFAQHVTQNSVDGSLANMTGSCALQLN